MPARAVYQHSVVRKAIVINEPDRQVLICEPRAGIPPQRVVKRARVSCSPQTVSRCCLNYDFFTLAKGATCRSRVHWFVYCV